MSPQSASSFVVPACDSCNNGFAPLEADAQGVVETLLDDGDVDELEISQLLDWFDKVRIGLWGADLMRNPGHSFVDRKLTVANRMGQKDRCLLVARTSCQERGLSFSGTWSPSFHATPSCFGLAINNLYFFNLSYEHAFSHRLGFPALVDRRFTAERLVAGDVRPGSGKTRLPVLKREVALDCLSIFQPCFGCPSMSETPDSFDSEFTQHHTLDATTGRGRIFAASGELFFAQSSPRSLELSSRTGYPRAFAQVAMKFVVADLQDWIDDLLPSTYLWSSEERRDFRKRRALVRAGTSDEIVRLQPWLEHFASGEDPAVVRAAVRFLRRARRREPLLSDNCCCSRHRPQPPESRSTSASFRTALVSACLRVDSVRLRSSGVAHFPLKWLGTRCLSFTLHRDPDSRRSLRLLMPPGRTPPSRLFPTSFRLNASQNSPASQPSPCAHGASSSSLEPVPLGPATSPPLTDAPLPSESPLSAPCSSLQPQRKTVSTTAIHRWPHSPPSRPTTCHNRSIPCALPFMPFFA